MLFVASLIGLAVSLRVSDTRRTSSFYSSADLGARVFEMSPWAIVGVTAAAYLIAYWLLPAQPWSRATWRRAIVGITVSACLLAVSLAALFFFYLGVTLVG